MGEPALLLARAVALANPRVALVGRERIISDEDSGTDPHDALINEIRETQLPRRLVFRNGRGARLALCVKAGRILRLGSETDDSVLLDADIDPSDLSSANACLAEALPRLLTRFATDGTRLSVTSHFWDSGALNNTLGLRPDPERSPAGSRSAAGAGAPDLEALAQMCLACVTQETDGAVIASGDAVFADRLRAHLPRASGVTSAAFFRQVPEGQCLIVGAGQAGLALLVARHGGRALLGVIANDQVDAALRRWSSGRS